MFSTAKCSHAAGRRSAAAAWAMLTCALLYGGTASAQDPSYVLDVTSASGVQGATVELSVLLDNGGSDCAGWSWGVCSDPLGVTALDAVDGATTATVNNGGPPDFDQITVLGEGWTVGVVICFTACAVLPPGTGFEMNRATYSLDGEPGTTVPVCFCDTLGSPPVQTVVVVSGQSVTPVQNCGSIEILAGPPPFSYIAPDLETSFDGSTGEGAFAALLSIAENPLNPGFPSDTQGFSMGIAHDPDYLEAIAIVPAGVVAELNLGAGPDFVGPGLFPDGATIGIVYSFPGLEVLVFDTPTEVIEVSYITNAANLQGQADPVLTPLTWSEQLGSPPVTNVVVVAGLSLDVEPMDGQVLLVPQLDTPFRRGDANDDGIVNVADGIWILNFLWLGGPASPCSAAANADGDPAGMVDTSDAIYLFSYRFLSGPPPPPPFPGCGTEPQADCAMSSACP